MKTLEKCAQHQTREDADEIVQILTAAFTDCRMSSGLRRRLEAVKERAERIVRNNAEISP